MSKVKRYEYYVNRYSHKATLRERDKGDVVKYEDYARLVEKNTVLELERDAYIKMLGTYIEMMDVQDKQLKEIRRMIVMRWKAI